MNEESKNKCPHCGYEYYTVIKDGSTFEGPIFRKLCLKCNGKYD